MKEITINTKNLVYHVLLKWRMILILGIVCALLANGYGIYSSYKSIKNIKPVEPLTLERQIEKTKEEMDKQKEDLTIREINDVDASIETYLEYEERFDEIKDYLDNSVLMQVDYSAIPTGNLTYYIDEFYEVEYPLISKKAYSKDLAMIYSEAILGGDTFQKISETCDLKPEYVRELVRAYNADDLLCIEVMGKDEEQCAQMLSILKENVKKQSFPLADYDIVFVSERTGTKVDDTIYEKQTKKINELNSIRANRNNIVAGMTDGQKKYFSAKMQYMNLLAMSEEGNNEELSNSNPANSTGDETINSLRISYFNIKQILVGLLAGLFIGCFIAIVSYMVAPVVRVKENLTAMKQSVLGSIWLTDSKKKPLGFIDKLITKWFYGRETGFELNKRIEMLCEGIRITVEKEAIHSLYITGASDKGNEIVKNLEAQIGDSVLVKTGDNILYNPQSLKSLSESETVLLVETAGDSRYDEVLKELEIAKQSKVKVIGFVLIQQ